MSKMFNREEILSRNWSECQVGKIGLITVSMEIYGCKRLVLPSRQEGVLVYFLSSSPLGLCMVSIYLNGYLGRICFVALNET